MSAKFLGRIFAAAFLAASVASWAQSDPHSDGLTFGQSQVSKSAGRVNDAQAKDAPYYNANPPQKSNFGAASLFQVGAQRITDCSNYVPTGDKLKDQECSAVNFLAKNPQNRVRVAVGANDPAILAGRAAMNGATESLANAGTCVPTTTTAPSEYAIRTCSEYLQGSEQQCTVGRIVQVDGKSKFQCDVTYKSTETITCSRGYGVSIENASSPVTIGLAQGYEIPSWSVKTYTQTLTVTGAPAGFVLKNYQADNWGQLWVNGTMVWSNAPWGDIRNGYTKIVRGTQLYSATGVNYGVLSDPGCEGGCLGQTPNRDITSFMKTGANTIEMVCVNANGIGPCSYTISGTENKPMVVGTYVDNQCATLEARSQ